MNTAGPRSSSDSQHLPAAFPGSLVPAGQAHQTGPRAGFQYPRLRCTTTPDPGTPPPATGLCALRELAWSQGPSAHQDYWDVTPHPTLGTVHSRSGQKEEDSSDAPMPQGRALLPHPIPLPRLLQPKP